VSSFFCTWISQRVPLPDPGFRNSRVELWLARTTRLLALTDLLFPSRALVALCAVWPPTLSAPPSPPSPPTHRDQLEKGLTHDELWNAAQWEMVRCCC